MASRRPTRSDGCAPTASQYLTRSTLSETCLRPSVTDEHKDDGQENERRKRDQRHAWDTEGRGHGRTNGTRRDPRHTPAEDADAAFTIQHASDDFPCLFPIHAPSRRRNRPCLLRRPEQLNENRSVVLCSNVLALHISYSTSYPALSPVPSPVPYPVRLCALAPFSFLSRTPLSAPFVS